MEGRVPAGMGRCPETDTNSENGISIANFIEFERKEKG